MAQPAAGQDAAGPAERELNRVVRRYAIQVRCLVVLLCAGFGAAAAAEGFVGRTAVVSGIAVVWSLLRLYWLRRPAPVLVVIGSDVLVAAALGLGQPSFGANPSSSWVYAAVVNCVITYPFEWAAAPRAAALAGWFVACWFGGISLTAPGAAGHASADLGRAVVQYGLALAGYLLLRSRGRAADRVAAEGAARRREASVARARRRDEREYLATLHDTASTTLLMVSAGDGEASRDWLPDRARRDLDILAREPGAGGGTVDLAALLATAAAHPHTRVELDVPDELSVPTEPGLAVFSGVTEAVSNLRHAGVDRARLRGAATAHGMVTVELSDSGHGFDPAGIPEHRRGVAGSIRDRIADAGGRAEIRSRPGEGTTVRWVWPDG